MSYNEYQRLKNKYYSELKAREVLVSSLGGGSTDYGNFTTAVKPSEIDQQVNIIDRISQLELNSSSRRRADFLSIDQNLISLASDFREELTRVLSQLQAIETEFNEIVEQIQIEKHKSMVDNSPIEYPKARIDSISHKINALRQTPLVSVGVVLYLLYYLYFIISDGTSVSSPEYSVFVKNNALNQYKNELSMYISTLNAIITRNNAPPPPPMGAEHPQTAPQRKGCSIM